MRALLVVRLPRSILYGTVARETICIEERSVVSRGLFGYRCHRVSVLHRFYDRRRRHWARAALRRTLCLGFACTFLLIPRL